MSFQNEELVEKIKSLLDDLAFDPLDDLIKNPPRFNVIPHPEKLSVFMDEYEDLYFEAGWEFFELSGSGCDSDLEDDMNTISKMKECIEVTEKYYGITHGEWMKQQEGLKS